MKNLKLILSFVLLLGCTLICGRIIGESFANQRDKHDYAEINHIKYGLLSVDQWKQHITRIVSEEIKSLDLTAANSHQIKHHLEIQLNALIDKVNEKIRESNKKNATGWLKQAFINTFVDIQDVKAGIPEYADVILAEMSKGKTENKLKSLVQEKVQDYLDSTFQAKDTAELDRVLARTAASDVNEARPKIESMIATHQATIYRYTWLLIGLALILFIMAGVSKDTLPAPQYIALLLTLVVLLATGVTVPMIDMEAKISELSFTLLNHPVTFTDQVLFFQSKSVFDVFWLMITHRDLQMKIVGLLMVGFSIIFPLLKMLSSLLFYYNFRKARDSKWIQFFVLKSGKWSMTDVLIVAIFMAYIGFNGVINSQFESLNSLDKEVVMLTTNGTSLQPGFYIFLTYTILALFLSEFLIRKPKEV